MRLKTKSSVSDRDATGDISTLTVALPNPFWLMGTIVGLLKSGINFGRLSFCELVGDPIAMLGRPEDAMQVTL